MIHHSAGSGMGIDTLSEQRAAMRAIERLHVDTNGWAAIGYLAVLFQPYGRLRRARVFVGRHDSQRAESIGPYLPAAQEGHNTGTIAVCVVGNLNNEGVKRATRRRLTRIAVSCRRRFGVTHLAGHREYGGTECPGDHLFRELDRIAEDSGLRRGARPNEWG